MGNRLQVLEAGPNHLIGAVGPVFLVHAHGRLPLADVGKIRARIQRVQGMTGYFQSFDATDGAADAGPEERKAWISLAEAAKAAFGAGALVVLREGFGGAAMRATISGVMLFAKGKTPTRVFGSLDDAAAWLVASGAARGVNPSELADAAREALRQFPAR